MKKVPCIWRMPACWHIPTVLTTASEGLSDTLVIPFVKRKQPKGKAQPKDQKHIIKKETDFINCVAWRKQAENVAKYCTKGSQVAVEGRIQIRSYDAQDGTKRYITEVIADNITFLSSRNGGSQPVENSLNTSSYTANNAVPNNNGMVNNDIVTADLDMDPYAAMGNEVSLTDDDLPF